MPAVKEIDRIDALEKVLGATLYAGDMYIEGMLYGVIVRSTRPHATISKINIKEAQYLEGVVKILSCNDIPGKKEFGIIKKDQSLLAEKKVRYVGEPVLVVVAETERLARKAAELIQIEYDDIISIHDPFTSEKAPVLIHGSGNLLSHRTVLKGDVQKGFRQSDVIVEHTYRTTWLDHAFLETEAGIGYMDNTGKLVILTSTQNVHYKRKEISRILGLPEENIRVIQATTGGGFGGKLDMTVECYVALAVYHTKKPVMIRFTREESFLSDTKRHPLYIEYKTGARRDGKIQAVEVNIIGDTGPYISYGETVCLRAAIHATGPYEVPNVHVDSRMFYTNNPISGAMRGFGVPQIAFAHESQMDEIAYALKLDPLHVRMINGLKKGSRTATSQILEASAGYIETLKRLEPYWQGRKKLKGRGFGLGSMFYGIGNTGITNPSYAHLSIAENGKIALHTGVCEIGQGSDTVLLQILCESLGVDDKNVELIRGDTDTSKDAGSTSASRQTYISGMAIYNASIKMREFLDKEGYYKGRGLKDIFLTYKEKGVPVFEGFFDPPTTALDPETSEGKPYATYAFATHMTEVEVDEITGYTKVLKVYAAHDVGKAINVRNIKGQVYGGIAMGIGFALMEEFRPGETHSLDAYYIPTSMDMPDVEVFIIEDEEPTGPFGAKGVGEPALIPQAASIVNAIKDAVDVRPFELPCHIERLKGLIESKTSK